MEARLIAFALVTMLFTGALVIFFPPTSTHAQEACDPSYPGVCIPSYPPDLNCGDVSDKGFEVLPPDPHSFDGDGDGVACES